MWRYLMSKCTFTGVSVSYCNECFNEDNTPDCCDEEPEHRKPKHPNKQELLNDRNDINQK